jgi:hypothetical protein
MRDLTQEEVYEVTGGRTPLPPMRTHPADDPARRYFRPQAPGNASPDRLQTATPSGGAHGWRARTGNQTSNRWFGMRGPTFKRHEDV